MKSLIKIGGLGAVLQSICLLALLIVVAVLMPNQGFAGDAQAFHTPQVALRYATQSFLFPEYYWIAWGFGVGLLLAALATYDLLQLGATSLRRLALTAGTLGAGFSVAEAIVGTRVIAELAELYIQQPNEAGPAYLAINLLTGALRVGGWHAYGWWALFTSLAGLQAKVLPRALWLMGIGVGLVGIGTFISELVIVHVLLGLVWPTWLGLTLLQHKES